MVEDDSGIKALHRFLGALLDGVHLTSSRTIPLGSSRLTAVTVNFD